MVDLRKDIDEVWFGIDIAIKAFERDGHRPSEAVDNCGSCYALHRLHIARERYKERHPEAFVK